MALLTDVARSAHRGPILHFQADPGEHDGRGAYEYLEDGLLLISDGLVAAVGPARQLEREIPAGAPVIEHGRDSILLPGFIDTHIHYPQTDVIGSGGQTLLEWLESYTFPEERKFSAETHAREVAEVFLDELVRNGTTTAAVYCTVHRASVEAFFQAASRRQMRMIAGKVLMDRNCPQDLCDSAPDGERESRELIERWHGHDRLAYAVTPRFAPTSSPEQLETAGRMFADCDGVYLQSHVAENTAEVAWARKLFPEARSYLDVYNQFGLLGERAIYGHCIYLDDSDRKLMVQTGSVAAFCPTSNLYLGSGLFDIQAADAAGMRFAIATDVGGGTSFNMLRTMGEAYKVAQLTGHRLSPLRAFYLTTLGAARCLRLEDRIGSFTPGAEADFVVLDLQATQLIARRTALCRTLADKLLVLMTLGDDRAIRRTYILGRQVHGP